VSESKGELVPAGQGGGLGRVDIGAAVLPRSMAEVKDLAKIAIASGLAPKDVRSAEAAFVIIATGMELGLSPMQALRGIHVINGKPILSSDLIVALVKRHPLCAYFSLIESTAERATYTTHRNGEPTETSLTWTLEDARRADLAGKGTWKHHPTAMLRARCSAALARAVYPDLLLGIYEEGEGEEIAARKPAPVREVAPVEAIEAEYVDGPDPVTLLEIHIDVAATEADLKACGEELRALGLTKGNPERDRLVGLLKAKGEALGFGPKAPATPTPLPPAAPALEPGADDEPFSDPTSALPPAAVPASSPAVAPAPAPRSKARKQHSDDLTDLCRLGKNACPAPEKEALDIFLHALLGADTGEAVARVEGEALKTRWTEKGEAVVAQLLSLHRDFLAGGAK
jgi:hypothetical protein